MSGPPDPQEIHSQIRANIAFEHMVMAVLTASAAGGALVFIVANGGAVAEGRWGLASFGGAAIAAVYFSFTSFLVGFFASVIVGLPLFTATERAKLRRVWPFVAAGIAVEIVAAGFMFGRIPAPTDFASLETAPLLLPGVLAALIFGRRMAPLWRAAERAETARTISRVQ